MGRGEGRGEGGARDRSDHGEGRAGGGQDLGFHQCPSCGLDCGTTTGLYRHVVVRCLDQLGQSIEEFKRKFQLRRKRARYQHHPEEKRAQVRGKVSQSPHIILGTFG